MKKKSAARLVVSFSMAFAGVAHADTWLCTHGSGHKAVATIDPTRPHWECQLPGGGTRLSTEKLHAQCVPVAPVKATCSVTRGDMAMALRVGMSAREVSEIYGEPRARQLRATLKGAVSVWLYEARPGPEFPIVYKDAQVSGWGPAYLQSISGTQPTY